MVVKLFFEKIPKTGPDSVQSWIAALLGGVIRSVLYFTIRVTGVLYFGFIKEWKVVRETASWPITLYIVSSELFVPVFTLLQHFASNQRLLIIMTCISAASMFFGLIVQDIHQTFIIFTIHGFCFGGIFLYSTILYLQHFKTKRTTATGLTTATSTVLNLGAPSITQTIVENYGVKVSLAFLGVVGLAAVVASFFLRTPKWFIEEEKNNSMDSDIDCERCDNSAANKSMKHRFAFMLSFRFVLDVFTVAVIYNSNFMFLQTALDYVNDKGIEQTSLVFPLYLVGGLIMEILGGFLIDHEMIAWKAYFAAAFAVEAVCWTVFVLSSNSLSILIFSFLMGCACGSTASFLAILLVYEFGLSRFSKSFAVTSCCCGIIQFFKPWLVGYFRDVKGSYDGLFFLSAALCCCCSIYWTIRSSASVNRQAEDE